MQIAEHHGLDDHGGSPVIGKVHLVAVDPRLVRMPRGENLEDGVLELIARALRNMDTPLFHGLFVGKGNLPHLFRLELVLLPDRIAALVTVHDLIEKVSFQALEHSPCLQEPPVGIPCGPVMLVLPGEALCDRFIDAHVEKGAHHARERDRCAASHGKQERVCGVAERFSRDPLQLADLLVDSLLQVLEDVLVPHDAFITPEDFRGDDESRRYGQIE